MAAARAQAVSPLEFEETMLCLLQRLLVPIDGREPETRPSHRDAELAHRALALLAARYHEPITLADIAADIEVSVYHLCRVFRRVMGCSLWQSVQATRAHTALEALAAGEADLTALALDLGYSHHSHFSASFRRQTGYTPSAARRLFKRGSLSEARALLAL